MVSLLVLLFFYWPTARRTLPEPGPGGLSVARSDGPAQAFLQADPAAAQTHPPAHWQARWQARPLLR